MSTTLWIVLAIVAVVIIMIIGIYNGLVRLRNRVSEAWSDIDVQLKRRYDLIPNLVETVKGYASHEKGTLEMVIKARNSAMQAQATGDKKQQAEAENVLSGTLKTIFALSENYPDLKANQNFLELQRELSDTENKIQASRRFYNSNILELNTKIEIFPSNILAGMFGFTKKEFFEIKEEEKANVKVSF